MKAMFTRQRRLRSSEAMRSLVRETRLSVDELIYPIFVAEGENIKTKSEVKLTTKKESHSALSVTSRSMLLS